MENRLLSLATFFFSFIALNTFQSAYSFSIFDPSQPQEIFFSVKTTYPQQYALFIMARSSFYGNFFQFDPNPPSYANFLSIVDLNPVKRNATLQYHNIFTQDEYISLGRNISTCVNETFLDCTVEPATQGICSLVKPIPSVDGIQIIDIPNLNCNTTIGNHLCDLALNDTTLINKDGLQVFQTQDMLCPEQLITINIMISALNAYIQPSNIVGGGTLTFHFHNIIPIERNSWKVSGTQVRIYEPSEVTQTVVLQPLTDPIYPIDQDYTTLIKTKLIRHNHTKNLYCRYALNYTGFIRGIYVNDYPSSIHSPHGVGLDLESQVESAIRLPLRANQYNFISIFGYRINLTSLEFIDCKEDWTTGPTIPVEFSTHIYDTAVLASQDYPIQATNYSCPSGCQRCTGEKICIKCQDYLAKGACQTLCPTALPIPDSRGICNSVLENSAVLVEPPQTTSNQVSISFYNDYDTYTPFVLVLHANKDLLLGATPIIWSGGPSLLVESIPILIPNIVSGINTVSVPSVNVPVSLELNEITSLYFPIKLSPYTFSGAYYTYQNITGFMHLKFIVRNANYFRPYVKGISVHVYPPSNPFFSHKLAIVPEDIPSLSLPNCINNQDEICYSCEQGFFLSPTMTECGDVCPSPYYSSPTDRVCRASCWDTESLSPDGTQCNPKCDRFGAFYTNERGCDICVKECGICLTSQTCLQCRFEDPSNNSTYCGRKKGTIFTSPDFNTSQNLTIIKDPDTKLAIIVASESYFSDLTFFFTNPPGQVPRIFKAIKMTAVSPNLAGATIPPLFLPESGAISMHYLKIKEENQNYSVTGLRQKEYMEWPLDNHKVPRLDAVVGPLEYNQTDGLELLSDKYTTVLASRLYEHDQSFPVKCQLQVTYSGDLRGTYANGELILSDSTFSETKQITVLSKFFMLPAGEMTMVTHVGYRLRIYNSSITNCFKKTTQASTQAVFPVFTSYTYSEADASSDAFNVTNNTRCGPNCVKCVDQQYCLSCEADYFLLDGRCKTQCPRINQYPLLFGFCETTVRNHGFRTGSAYNKNTAVLGLSYSLVLGLDLEIIVIIHPFPVTPTTHAAYVFIPDDDPTFAEGAYQVINYSKTQTSLTTYISVKPEAKRDYDTYSVLMYTIKRDLMLFMNYSGFPDTIAKLQNPDTFNYIPLNDTEIVLQASQVSILDFFLNCSSTCQISFELVGNIEVLLNERTYLFNGYIESFVGPVLLQRSLSSVNHVVIKLWNTTGVTLKIQGNYSIFTQGQFILENNSTDIPKTLCTQANCENCYKDHCLSCKEGFMLDQVTGVCTKQCSLGTKGDLFQRICGQATCSFSTSSLFVGQEDSCVWNCLNYPYFYYNISEGCTRQCSDSCALCSGPLENHCLSCKAPHILHTNKTCICPVGTQANSTGGCDSVSFLVLKNEPLAPPCVDAAIEAQVRADEILAYNLTFFWELVSSNASLSSQAAVQSYLASQTSRTITIPRDLLENNNYYSFRAYYFNVLNDKIENITTIQTTLDVLKNFTLLIPPLRNYMTNTIHVEPSNYACLLPKLDATWAVTFGPLQNTAFYNNPENSLEITIPGCSLPPDTKSTLTVIVWLKDNPSISAEMTADVITRSETFDVIVQTNTRDHPEVIDLPLQGRIDYYDFCEVREAGETGYYWKCNKTLTNGVTMECPDTDGLFGVQRSTGDLVYPLKYFSNGDVLTFMLFVEKNGVTKNSSIDIYIKPFNTYILNTQLDHDSARYIANNDYVISALLSAVSISGAQTNLTNFEGLSFQWSTYPTLPFVAFQDKMKILSNDIQFPSNISSIQVQLTVSNGTYNGVSSLSLPINRPPSDGSISVLPAKGISLATNFTISLANWQDEDVPITYEYYYSFVPNDNYTPLIFTPVLLSQLKTFLPAKPPSGGTVYVKVYVRDYFGAASTALGQTFVEPQNITLEQSLNMYTSTLNSVGKSDYKSLGSLVGIISKELSGWENMYTAKMPQNACPTCSNHGFCLVSSNQCKCEIGWGLPDCSVTSATIQRIIEFKQTNLITLAEIYGNSTQKTNMTPVDGTGDGLQQLLYQTLKEASQNVYFNTNESLTLVQNVLENTLGILDSNTTLVVSEQVDTVSEILSNMLSYASVYDCAGDTEFSKDLVNKTLLYLQKVAQSSLSAKIATENATIIDTDNIYMYFQRLSLCDLQEKVLSGGDGAPELSMKLKYGFSANCSSQVDLKYYAFNDNLLNCAVSNNTQNTTKNLISIELSDPTTGTSIDLNGLLTITISSGTECPSVCTVLDDKSCSCDSLSPFDLKSQIIRLFEYSNAAKLFKIETLLQFQFWKSASFWGIAVFTGWFLISIYVVKNVMPVYSSLAHFKQLQIKNKFRIFVTALSVVHPLFSVYCTHQKNFSKTMRAVLYFTRTILLLAVTSSFNEANNDTEFKFELFNFDIYLILLPFFTIIPIYAILTWLIEPLPINPNITKTNKLQGLRITWTKCKVLLGRILIFMTISLSLLAVMIINANQNDVQRLMWTVDFVNSIFQDIFITPLVYLSYQYALFRFYGTRYCKTKIARIIYRFLDHNLLQLRDIITPIRPRPLSTVLALKLAFQKTSLGGSSTEGNGNASDTSSTSSDKNGRSEINLKKGLDGVNGPLIIPEEPNEESPYRLKPEIRICEIDVNNNKDGQDLALSDVENAGVEYRTPKVFRKAQSTMELHEKLDQNQNKAVKNMLRILGMKEPKLELGEDQKLEDTQRGNEEEDGLNDPKSELFKVSLKESESRLAPSPQMDITVESAFNLSFLKKDPLCSPTNISQLNAPSLFMKSISNSAAENSDRRRQEYQKRASGSLSSRNLFFRDRKGSPVASCEFSDILDQPKQNEEILKTSSSKYSRFLVPKNESPQLEKGFRVQRNASFGDYDLSIELHEENKEGGEQQRKESAEDTLKMPNVLNPLEGTKISGTSVMSNGQQKGIKRVFSRRKVFQLLGEGQPVKIVENEGYVNKGK